jgi:DNA-binding MarR family transcriptional regulator
MRLTRPTDFDILAALDEHGRNIAANLALHLDRDRAYLNTRLPHLSDHGLVRKVGPATDSGLYELTERGRAAVAYRESYEKLGPDAFETVVEDAIRS